MVGRHKGVFQDHRKADRFDQLIFNWLDAVVAEVEVELAEINRIEFAEYLDTIRWETDGGMCYAADKD